GDVYKAALPSMMKPQDLEDRYRSRTETYIRLNTGIHDIDRLTGRSKKQAELYQALRQLFLEEGRESIPKKEITAKTGYSNTVLKGLTEKNIVIQYPEEVSRIDTHFVSSRKAFNLN